MKQELESSPFETLIQAAVRAPSGDNTQPWRFAVDTGVPAIEAAVDPSRDQSPMNAGQRMARIAVGAAVENMLVMARHNGWTASVDARSDSKSSVIIQCQPNDQSGQIPPLLLQRVTNRRLYDGRPIAPAETAPLEQATSWSGGVRAIWITERSQMASLATVVGRADALMFGMRAVRKAFLENVRFDRPPREEVEEGLSLGSLEVNLVERFGLGLLGKFPDRLFRWAGMGGSFRRKATELVRSASGLCVLATSNDAPTTDFEVGQMMERAWLELTARDFAVQPMMSLPVLENLLTNSLDIGSQPSLISQTRPLSDAFGSLLGLVKNERIAAILRFGHAPAPTGRTGRRSGLLHAK